MEEAAEALAGVRSILETPLLDPHKWQKIHDMDVDAVLLDMEDSVPPARKLLARERVVACIDDPRELGGSLGLPRVNRLDSEWGHDDLCALAQHGAPLIVYPKIHSAKELDRIGQVLADHGSHARIIPIIETAQAVLELESIAAHERTAGFLFGPSDLAEDVGWSLFSDDRLFASVYYYPRSKLALTAAAFHIPVFDFILTPNLRDSVQIERAVRDAKAFGFTGVSTFYPPHLEIIRSVFTPSSEEIANARQVIAIYENAMSKGAGAVQIDGHAIIVQDYKRAKRLIAGIGHE